MNKLISTPFGAWIFIFILAPLLTIFYYGFTDKTGAFTFDNVIAITTVEHSKALWLALGLSLISTLICFLLAYPLAYFLSQMNMNSSGYIIFIFVLPMWMNFLLRTLAWQTLIEKTGVINAVLTAVNLPNINIINTYYAIVLGMVYNFLPFMVLPLYNSIAKIDPNVVNAARDLGANSVQTFRRVIFPLSIPGIVSGITMVFIPSLTTFVISKILGGSKILLIGNIIEQEFTVSSNWHLGAGLSIVLMLFVIINMVITSFFEKDEEVNKL
ncbi:MAG: ABC transporter permease [Lachnospiraceae bacterium]